MWATIIRPPENSPADPILAIARPIIRTIEDGATAYIKLPISKIPTNKRKIQFGAKYGNILPTRGWQAQLYLSECIFHRDKLFP